MGYLQNKRSGFRKEGVFHKQSRKLLLTRLLHRSSGKIGVLGSELPVSDFVVAAILSVWTHGKASYLNFERPPGNLYW